ncbi:MAG TPA: UDP-N-acetylglucosamine 2-epimerase (hydrolyzing), partial [Sulfurospirillum arcachonense]|nr:UDP-N-acetylglucosamine 2-epimerase (hydrolyzing) [Sulfurospirillum arcachonense]
EKPEVIFENILKTLKEKRIYTFVSYPNVDPGNYDIRKVIEKYSQDKNFMFYKNLDRDMFLSIYKQSDFILGNSSSGVCEAASIAIPALNIGTRQTGRYAEENVIFTDSTLNAIKEGIDKVSNSKFQISVENMKNPYGDGSSASQAYEIIKNKNFKSMLLKTEDALEIKNG